LEILSHYKLLLENLFIINNNNKKKKKKFNIIFDIIKIKIILNEKNIYKIKNYILHKFYLYMYIN